MALSLRCPICRDKFPWVSGSAYPDKCPSCHEHIGSDRDESEIVMPFIRSAGTKANDDVYRQIERSSEVRAEKAAQMAGVPVSEMSDLRITNLRDNKGYGDVMAPPPPVIPGMGFSMPGASQAAMPAPLEASSRVSVGPYPNAGARMQSVVRQMHANTGQAHAVGDSPALETQQPGYRRRV